MYIKYLSYTRIKNEFVDVRVAEWGAHTEETFAVCQGCYGVEPTVFRNIPTVYTARSVLKTVSLLRSTVWYDWQVGEPNLYSDK